ncbi:hypothetical protein Y032_0001g263 [Ancylostoma ceylanicum]|uniref:Transmembrane protein 222 n=2 Tax=Ancylostoma ceylanicum TaxID=53326 RepID=A0A016W3B6_9BILA|nr:hypothetical protein Y032_0001g263 [Ancylostoma ceylanicum]
MVQIPYTTLYTIPYITLYTALEHVPHIKSVALTGVADTKMATTCGDTAGVHDSISAGKVDSCKPSDKALVGSGGPVMATQEIDVARHRFPFCIVWTPLPVLTWIFPLIGHMGIATSKGIIRDFAGSYYVAEDEMGFDWPTMYWQLSADSVEGGAEAYDRAIREASDEYKGRMHNLCCDNCHSHVALALNTMRYGDQDRWNMVKLAVYMQIYGKYTGIGGFLKQWTFFLLICIVVIVMIFVF